MQTIPFERMPAERKLSGLREYEAALDELIAESEHTIRIFDRGLSRSFNSPERYEQIRKFLLARRANRILVALHDVSQVVRDCPRVVLLFKQFSHSLFMRQTLPAARRVQDPFAIGDDARYARRFHFDDARGMYAVGDLGGTVSLTKRFDEIWAASSPSAVATTTGL